MTLTSMAALRLTASTLRQEGARPDSQRLSAFVQELSAFFHNAPLDELAAAAWPAVGDSVASLGEVLQHTPEPEAQQRALRTEARQRILHELLPLP
ncbi:hypothetical protein GO986_12230 [Deinococcus sp. HMF7620]|uniref:Uncharacterized protein n=1 Tax=Deinococcus arboris TaxID=2682977 RepID=A0A7C9HSD3_9DEIO|nr:MULTISPECIES: hypothetical protein [Deinococcus]MBZ9752214.1 hypothetical protein [Deinococcus betulae]MVN87533.1 hypothetical protein [Deinococcus arboris]